MNLDFIEFVNAAWVQYLLDERNTLLSTTDLIARKELFFSHALSGKQPPFQGLGSMNYHLMRAYFGYRSVVQTLELLDK